jgi:hypothetical protein
MTYKVVIGFLSLAILGIGVTALFLAHHSNSSAIMAAPSTTPISTTPTEVSNGVLPPVSPSKSTIESKDSTSSNNTEEPLANYSNIQYGFTFQYPSTFELIDNFASQMYGGGITLYSPDGNWPSILIDANPTDQTLDAYFYAPSMAGPHNDSEVSFYDSDKESGEDIATTTLGGVTAIETSFKCGVTYPGVDNGDPKGQTLIVAVYHNNLYQLTAPDICSDPDVSLILNEINTTFKFLN